MTPVARLGVVGGTFDPVHLGHLVLAETAREQARLDTVLFVPAGQPWRKTGRQIAPADDRLAMLRLATADNPVFSVSTIETERPGPSYTADTLSELQEQRPGAELFFIAGEDALLDLPHWRKPERICRLATLLVARRQMEGGAPEPPAALPDARVTWLEMPLLQISASQVRSRVAAGLSVRYLVPDPVATYIRERRLYSR